MSRSPGLIMGMLFCVGLGSAAAQGLRDPTLPPLEVGLSAGPTAGGSLRLESGAMSIIVRKGRSYLVVGTRLYSQGQTLGQARIERITETEVWLREGGVLRKVPRFNGIERHAAPPASSTGCVATRPAQRQSPQAPSLSSSSPTSATATPCATVRH